MPTRKAWAPAKPILAAALIVCATQSLAGSPAVVTSGVEQPGSVVTTRKDANDRLTVPVLVNGSGPFRFLVDTGANRTVVSDRLASALQLPAGPTRRLVSITDAEDVATAGLDSLEVGGLRHEAFDAAVLAEEPLGATGVLGIDNLSDRRIVFDFGRHAMSISGAQRIAPADRDPPGTIVVVARKQAGQLIMTNAYYRNHRINVVVDTGAQISIGNLALLHLIQRRGPVLPMSTVTSVTGKTAPVQIAILPAVQLDKLSLDNDPIAFADLACFARFGLADQPAMLLGMDVLRQFSWVAIDFKRRQVSFALPQEIQREQVVNFET